MEKQLVGPGLGVGAHVPAVGGFQQTFRVNPVNVGEYRLTTLPGRAGHAGDTTGGRAAVVGELTHNKPDTTAYLPSRLPTVPGRAQGMSGLVLVTNTSEPSEPPTAQRLVCDRMGWVSMVPGVSFLPKPLPKTPPDSRLIAMMSTTCTKTNPPRYCQLCRWVH